MNAAANIIKIWHVNKIIDAFELGGYKFQHTSIAPSKRTLLIIIKVLKSLTLRLRELL